MYSGGPAPGPPTGLPSGAERRLLPGFSRNPAGTGELSGCARVTNQVGGAEYLNSLNRRVDLLLLLLDLHQEPRTIHSVWPALGVSEPPSLNARPRHCVLQDASCPGLNPGGHFLPSEGSAGTLHAAIMFAFDPGFFSHLITENFRVGFHVN